MSFVKLPEEILTDPNITDLQIRIIANLIKYSYNDNKSYIGYDKLAEACMVTKRAIINNINKLSSLGFLRVNHRGNFSKSNEIELTLKNGLGVNEYSPLTGSQGVNADSPQGERRFTPHIDLKFKNLDLNFKNGDGVNADSPLEKKTASVDLATDRSMPIAGQAGENTRQENDYVENLRLQLQTHFSGNSQWINIVEANGSIGLKLTGGKISGINPEDVENFAKLHGIKAFNPNFNYQNERKL